MKTRLILFVIALCGAFATTAAFGQATGNAVQTNFVWIAAGSNIDVGTSTNWTPTGVPSPARRGLSSDYGDIMAFDGQTTGPVDATSNGGSQGGSSVGGLTAGLYLHVTANQVNRVTLHTTVAGSASSGMRFNSIGIDAGSGGLTFGTGSTTNCLDTLWGVSWPSTQGLTNNSSYPAIINKDMRWRYGAGGVHTIVFSGTGDWYITNDVANVNGAGTIVTKDGSGTMYWTGGHNSYWGNIATIGTLNISGGTLVYQSSGLLLNNTTIAMSSNAAPAKFEFNVVGGSQTFNNTISGNGSVQVDNGIVTLSGVNTYTGDTILRGGELIAGGVQNPGGSGSLGNGGMISFTGGTLGFSSVNTYDYSPRFTNSAGQAYSFDTAGNYVEFTNALTSSGGTLTKLGPGTLLLGGANTYSGLTTVSAGTLAITNGAGAGAITVANSATLDVFDCGVQLTPATLTVGTTASADLSFDNITSTTTVPLAVVGEISAGGRITVNVNSGSFLIGQHYPLFSWGSGNAPAVVLGAVVGAVGNLTTNGNTIQLNVTGLAYAWTGLNDANWDATTTNNWKVNGVSQIWADGNAALFDDTITTANTNLTLYSSSVTPASTTFNNSAKPYLIQSDGILGIAGSGGMTKNGSGPLTLWFLASTYTGPTTLNGGVLNILDLENGGVASDIGASSSDAANLVFNGGTLTYGGSGVTSDRGFTLGTGGGTINNASGQPLTLNNPGAVVLKGTGARTLTLAASSSSGTLAAVLGDNGGATALAKSGLGTWILTGNNTNSGAVAISGGTLQVGDGGATGSVGSGNVTVNPGTSVLDFNTTATLTNGTVGGTGRVTVEGGGKVVLPGTSSYSGGTTIASGSTLQVGIGGATGSLFANGAITDNGLLIFNTTSTVSYSAAFSGSGNMIVRGGGRIANLGGNTYTGWTLIDPGSTFQPCSGNQSSLSSSVVTNNGTLLLVRQDNGVFVYTNPVTGSGRVWVDANNVNAGDVTLGGACDYTGGTFIGDNGLVLASNGWITGNVTFVKSTEVPYDNPRTLTFTRPDNVTFPGNIVTNFSSAQVNLGIVVQNGTGVLTLTGTNTYGSGTTIANGGTLQVGNGGTSGSIGNGAVTDNGTLVWNRSDSVTFGANISGPGSVVQAGSGRLTLAGNLQMTGSSTEIVTNIDNSTTTNTLVLTGSIVASNGTLVVTSGSLTGNLNVAGGTFAALSAGGSLVVSSNATISAGTVLVALNKSLLPQTNIIVRGTLTQTGGNLVVTNVGPNLAVHDKFYIFSAPVTGMTVSGADATWQNDLAVDGSITALTVPVTVNTNRPVMQVSVVGNTLNLGWPTNLGWTLETNSVGISAANQWFPYPGSATVTNVSITINPAHNNVYFRMVYTNTP
jgi:fibronectin-binding autotransporter adhesin